MAYSRAIAAWEDAALQHKRIKLIGTEAEKDAAAKEVIRYAVTELLGWTPEEAQAHMTPRIIEQLNLTDLVRCLILPPDCTREDYDYIIPICFNRPPDVRKQLLSYYKRIQNGEIARFPKDLFIGENGRVKAAMILGNFIAHNLAIPSDMGPEAQKESLYEKFADYGAMNQKFRDSAIYYVCHNLYSNPLEYLHYSLRRDEQDDFLFSFHEFNNVLTETYKLAHRRRAS